MEVATLKVALSLMNEAAVLLGYCGGSVVDCGGYEVRLRTLIEDIIKAQDGRYVVKRMGVGLGVEHRSTPAPEQGGKK